MISIELSFQQLKDAVSKLSLLERLEPNEAIWNEDTAIPIQHQRIVYERIKTSEENPEELLDWDTALMTLHY
jgi:hypothetical protein